MWEVVVLYIWGIFAALQFHMLLSSVAALETRSLKYTEVGCNVIRFILRLPNVAIQILTH
jgi:hypothetical protein